MSNIQALVDALTELVDLKNLKDQQGKTAEYLYRQPKAWHNATQALADYHKSQKEEGLREKYKEWCKLTKRNGHILIGSMNEFFDWYENYVPSDINSDEATVAMLRSSVGNPIEQYLFNDKNIGKTIRDLPERFTWGELFEIAIGIPTGTQNFFRTYFKPPERNI